MYRFNIFDFSEVMDKLILHCKNFEALEQLNGSKKIRYFWHQKDKVTLLSDGTPWTYPGYVIKNGIACEPDMRILYPEYKKAKGICTDYPIDLKESLPIYY
jgi:hypothetical protein